MRFSNDLIFEIELLKQIDLNIDYIFDLVQEMRNKHIENKELVLIIYKTLDSSYELRSKKELILEFIKSLEENKSIKDVVNLIKVFNVYKINKMKEDLTKIINEFNLKAEETNKYIDNCFKIGELKTIGTDIEKILPQVSRFSFSNDLSRYKIKNKVIDKLQEYFDKFFSI